MSLVVKNITQRIHPVPPQSTAINGRHRPICHEYFSAGDGHWTPIGHTATFKQQYRLIAVARRRSEQ